MNKKLIILYLSGLGTGLFLLMLTKTIDICTVYCSDNLGNYHKSFILFFSLVTFWLPEKYFTAWWRFARIAILVIFQLVLLINLNLHHTPGGWFNTSNIFDVPALVFLYAIFTIGSVLSLYCAYRTDSKLVV